MTNVVVMMTTMAINGGLKSTGSFDGSDDDVEGGGGRTEDSDGDWAHSGDGAGAGEIAVMGLFLRFVNGGGGVCWGFVWGLMRLV